MSTRCISAFQVHDHLSIKSRKYGVFSAFHMGFQIMVKGVESQWKGEYPFQYAHFSKAIRKIVGAQCTCLCITCRRLNFTHGYINEKVRPMIYPEPIAAHAVTSFHHHCFNVFNIMSEMYNVWHSLRSVYVSVSMSDRVRTVLFIFSCQSCVPLPLWFK